MDVWCRPHSGGGHGDRESDRKVSDGAHRLGVHVERLVRKEPPSQGYAHGVWKHAI